MKNNTPKLPAGWKMEKLENACDILDSKRVPVNAKERALRQGDIPYYGANGQQGWIDDYLFDEKLILLAEDGGNYLDSSRPNAYVIEGKSWVNNHAHILRPKDNWKFDWVFCQLAWMNLENYVNGSTRLKLNQGNMKKIQLIYPPFETQKQIVAKLTESQNTLDEALASLNEAEKRLENVMASALHKLIPDDESKLPDGWEMVELQNIVNFDKKTIIPLRGKKYSYLSLENINPETGEISELPQADGAEIKSSKNSFSAGQILFSKLRPYLNKVVIANKGGICVTDIIPLTLKKGISKEYLWFYLRSNKILEYVKFHMAGIRMPRLRTKEFKQMPIALPPLHEQEKIVARLAQIKEQVNLARSLYVEAKKRTESIQQALLQKAFRGELVYESKKVIARDPKWCFRLTYLWGALMEKFQKGQQVLHAKNSFFAQELFNLPFGIQFSRNNFGPFHPDIKKALNLGVKNKYFLYDKNKSVIKGPNFQKLMSYSYEKENAVAEKLFSLFKDKSTDEIELIATVFTIIKEFGTVDINKIYQEMKKWKVKGRGRAKTKADIFTIEQTTDALEFIQAREWDKSLSQK